MNANRGAWSAHVIKMRKNSITLDQGARMNQEPHNGDFASQLEKLAHKSAPATVTATLTEPAAQKADTDYQRGIPLEEVLEMATPLADQPPMCEDELARQALAHPGDDGDTTTPE